MDNDIEIFATEMEATMNKHKEEKGDSWKTCSMNFLERKLEEEMDEYVSSRDPRELPDIGNCCMMLYNRKTRDMKKKQPEKQFAIDLEIMQQKGNAPFTTMVKYKIDGDVTPESLKSAILAGIMKLTEMHKELDNTIMVIDEKKK